MSCYPKNPYGIDHDKPGLCAFCFCPVAEFNGSDQFGNFVITKLMPNFRLVGFELSDGSVLKVTLCEKCADTMEPKQCAKLMESVINGWQEELNRKGHHWPEEAKKAHMNRYAKHQIVNRADNPWGEALKAQVTRTRKSNLRVKT